MEEGWKEEGSCMSKGHACSYVSACVRVCPRVSECVRVCQARQVYRHGEFTDTLCLQNKTYKHDSKFTDTLCLQKQLSNTY